MSYEKQPFKNLFKRYEMAFWVALAVFVFAWAISAKLNVNSYKQSCEPLSTNPHKVEWLECKP